MKRFSFLLIAMLISGTGYAQSALPRDTSFTIYSAYIKTLKTNPGISIVKTGTTKSVKTERNITYCSDSLGALLLDVFYPSKKTARLYPAVLLIHGGGWRSGDRAQQEPMAAWLAADGYVAATMQYRLSAEAKYPAAIQDVKAAIRWLRARAGEYAIDTGRIAVLGCSAGGQLAALAGATNDDTVFDGLNCNRSHSSRVQAIIDVDGILAFIHPESGEGDERKGSSAATQWLGGTQEMQPSLWQQASPLNHVSAATPPVLFINSSVVRMHAGRDDLIRRLDSLHIYSERHTFNDAPHPFWLFHPWFEPMMQYIHAFLEKVF